jgi:hypothetical protein
MLPLSLAEGAEDFPPEYLGAYKVRVGRGRPWCSQFQGLDGCLINLRQRLLVAADVSGHHIVFRHETDAHLMTSYVLTNGYLVASNNASERFRPQASRTVERFSNAKLSWQNIRRCLMPEDETSPMRCLLRLALTAARPSPT